MLAPGGDAAAAPEIFHARGFERVLVNRGLDVTQGALTQLFERVSHGESYNVTKVTSLQRTSVRRCNFVTLLTFVTVLLRRLLLLRFIVQRGFRLIDNRLERALVSNSEIGEDLAIEIDAGGF